MKHPITAADIEKNCLEFGEVPTERIKAMFEPLSALLNHAYEQGKRGEPLDLLPIKEMPD